MWITAALLIELTLAPVLAHAADDTGKIVPFVGRRGLLRTPADNSAIQTIRTLFTEVGILNLPPYALRYARQLSEDQDRTKAGDDLERYQKAFRHYAHPLTDAAPGRAPEDAHESAIAMIQRRPRIKDIDFEIETFHHLYAALTGFGYDARERRDEASRMAEHLTSDGIAEPLAPKADPINARVGAAMRRMDHAYAEQNLGPVPSLVKTYAFNLANSFAYVDDVKHDCAAYAAALKFGVGPLGESGLGLSAAQAHQRILAIPERKFSAFVVNQMADVYAYVYRRLTAPTTANGFGLTAIDARDQALELTEQLSLPVIDYATEALDRRLIWPPFFTTPIREGGLGLTPAEVAPTMAQWQNRYLQLVSGATLIETYQSTLARYLAKAATDGAPDYVRARDWAIEQLGDGFPSTLRELPSRLDLEGYPHASPNDPPPVLPQALAAPKVTIKGRILACVRGLVWPGVK